MTAQDTLNNQRADEVKFLRAAHKLLTAENIELKLKIEGLQNALATQGYWYESERRGSGE